MTSRVLHLDILGQRYAVKSELDPQYVSELAGYLDAKMRLAASELASADPLRVAIVAALNLTDEVFRARADSTNVAGTLRDRALEIERIVDTVLAGAAIKVAVNE